jgi:hypothetical protein
MTKHRENVLLILNPAAERRPAGHKIIDKYTS